VQEKFTSGLKCYSCSSHVMQLSGWVEQWAATRLALLRTWDSRWGQRCGAAMLVKDSEVEVRLQTLQGRRPGLG